MKKLSISSLKVQSFVTSELSTHKIAAGWGGIDFTDEDLCTAYPVCKNTTGGASGTDTNGEAPVETVICA